MSDEELQERFDKAFDCCIMKCDCTGCPYNDVCTDSPQGKKVVINRAMNIKEAYNKICKEYIDNLHEIGCDGCMAQIFCIKNDLRTDRYPQKDCVAKLQKYLQEE